MMEVSRQTVNKWVSDGKISTYPDGTIDPKRAMREYMLNTDPTRVRARVMRTATSDIDELKSINSNLTRQLEQLKELLQNANHGLKVLSREYLEYTAWLDRFCELCVEHHADIGACADDEIEALLDDLFNQAGDYAAAQNPADQAAKVDPEISTLLVIDEYR